MIEMVVFSGTMGVVLSPQIAGKLLMAGLIALALFHILVITGILPSGIVWGGQVESSASDLILMEAVSLVVTLLFLLIVIIRLGCLWAGRFGKPTRVGLWLMGVFFLVSMAGNLASEVDIEKSVMAPFALLLAILSIRLAAAKRPTG